MLVAHIVERNEDEQPRILRRQKSHERRHVPILIVGAVFRIHHLRGAGLARHCKSIDARFRRRAAVGHDDVAQKQIHLMRDVGRDRTAQHLRRMREYRAPFGVVRRLHHVRPNYISAVRDGRVCDRKLDRRDCDALPETVVREIDFLPSRRLVQQPARFARQIDPRARSDSKRAQPFVVAFRSQRQRDFRRADIRRHLDNPAEIQPSVRAVIVDRVAVEIEMSVLAVELFVGRDRVIGQRNRAEDSLHRRARLERVLDRRVVQAVVNVGAAGADVGHRHHFAGERIEHDNAAALGPARLHFGGQFGFRERLDARVDRQLELRARLRRLERHRAVENRMPLRVMIEAQLDRLAARNLVVAQLQPGEPLAVHPRQPHHRRGQVALRVKSFVFADRADAVDAERFDRLRLVR